MKWDWVNQGAGAAGRSRKCSIRFRASCKTARADLEELKLTETRQANVRITEPGAVATAFMVRYSFGSLKAVATAPGSVITLRLPQRQPNLVCRRDKESSS